MMTLPKNADISKQDDMRKEISYGRDITYQVSKQLDMLFRIKQDMKYSVFQEKQKSLL